MKKIVSTNNAPAAIGPYSQAVIINNMVYCSGSIPLNPQTGEMVGDDIKAQTIQVFKNINAVLDEAGTNLGNVIKTTVFLKDINDFAGMNEIYANEFKNLTFPARSAVEVANLPKNALVEIEVIAEI